MISQRNADALFRQDCVFVAGAATPDRIPPPTKGEIAFAGRSNVGKSSLINALVNRKGLARSSNTPGRTQQINFFDLGGAAYLVDLPGYGFAAAPDAKVEDWNAMVHDYVCRRPTLKRLCLLVDSRRGLKDIDHEALELLEKNHVPVVLILTKADKIKAGERAAILQATQAESKKEVFMTSCEKKEGISELRIFLANDVLAVP